MTNEELVLKIQNDEDKKHCLELLYLQNKKMIAKIASKYSGYVDFEDLMQEGFFGLCNACEHWDNCKGTFLSYATYHILNSINRYVADNKNTIRVPECQGEMIRKYNKLSDEHITKTSKAPSDRYLILHLGITAQQLKQLKKDAQVLNISSFETPVKGDEKNITLEDIIKDPADQYEQLNDRIQNEQLAKEIWDIVDSLEEKQSFVIRERYQHNETLGDIAEKLQVTRDSVVHSQKMAMRELRKPKNKKRLAPYCMGNDLMYSISLGYSSLGYFNKTWTSAPERAVLLEEEMHGRNN